MSFGAGLAQGLQPGIAYLTKKNADEAEEKRVEKRVASDRAYGAMQESKRELKESKKELYRLGGTEEEAETYNEDNLYAIGLRIAELRDQYNAGRTGQLSGEGSGQPVDSLLGDTGIATSAGYMKGVQVAKSEQLEQKFKDQLARDNASAIRGDLRKDAEQTRLDRAVAFGASRPELPFDFNQPIDKIELDQADVEKMEAHNIARMQAGLKPMPLSERLFTSGMQPEGTGTARRPMEPSFTKPTEGSYSELFNAEQLRASTSAQGKALASASGQLDAVHNQAARRALVDKNLPPEYIKMLDDPNFIKTRGSLMYEYYENKSKIQYLIDKNLVDQTSEINKSVWQAASDKNVPPGLVADLLSDRPEVKKKAFDDIKSRMVPQRYRTLDQLGSETGPVHTIFNYVPEAVINSRKK